ncbi:hypothetical protein ACFFSY_22820 [Paenibacillus aurantiacus]|uniref:Uncharacterized protein n=1 Tax=Paenibacillus aurantiacus TaxID=1936118 RepID=A0ABV5KU77_9BACL
MRAMLMSMLLIIVVVTIYMNTTGGEEGTNERLAESGRRMSESVARTSP